MTSEQNLVLDLLSDYQGMTPTLAGVLSNMPKEELMELRDTFKMVIDYIEEPYVLKIKKEIV